MLMSGCTGGVGASLSRLAGLLLAQSAVPHEQPVVEETPSSSMVRLKAGMEPG